MEITLKSEGTAQIIARLETMADNVTDFTEAWPEVKAVILNYQGDYFRTSGFGTFAPLKSSTLKRKNRRTPRPFDTNAHDMWDSFIGTGPDFYYDASKTRMEIGVEGGPAHWHTKPRKHMEARPPIRVTPRLRREVKGVLKGHVLKRGAVFARS